MEQIEIEQLVKELVSGDDARAEVASRLLAELGSVTVPHLEALLNHAEPEHRWWATRTLSQIADPCVPELLLKAFHDPEPPVRHCAALAMRFQPDPRFIPHLLSVLADPDRLLAHLAADALTAIGKDAVPGLIETIQKGSHTARLESVRALSKIGDPRAIPTLFGILDGDSALLEHWADQGLDNLGLGTVFFKP